MVEPQPSKLITRVRFPPPASSQGQKASLFQKESGPVAGAFSTFYVIAREPPALASSVRQPARKTQDGRNGQGRPNSPRWREPHEDDPESNEHNTYHVGEMQSVIWRERFNNGIKTRDIKAQDDYPHHDRHRAK